MPPGRHDINLVQGDSFRRDLRFERPPGTAYDLSGHTFKAQVRPKYAAGTLTATMTVTVIAAPDGRLRLTMAPAVTTTLTPRAQGYTWDLQWTDPAGTVLTILSGDVHVTPEVSV